MRTPNLGTSFNQVGEPPSNPDDMSRFLRDELQKISSALQALALGHVDMTTVAPTKPREGDIRLANGTTWVPGATAGVYCFYSGAWNFLG